MAQNISLQMRQTQKLSITPQLRQAIKILQYSHTEMVEHVEQQLLENPTLEAVPYSEGASESEDHRRDAASADRADSLEQQNGAETSVDWERFLEHLSDRGPGLASGSLGGTIYDDLPPIETNLTYAESLVDHLIFQIQMMRMRDEERVAAEAIIQNLDERGYLGVSLEQVCEATDVAMDIVIDALDLVQTLDPEGCGARNLAECLVLQARRLYPEDPNFVLICEGHLHHLEARNYDAIARELGLHRDDVIEYHKMIREFEPIPGRAFASEAPRYIEPDLYVRKISGRWVVLSNDQGIPDLRLNTDYMEMLGRANDEEKAYLTEKLQGARYLIRSIHKRRRTIERVMEKIVENQEDFFEHGVKGLRPMILQEIADQIPSENPERRGETIHMSTVSRVTTNKYVHTPHGIFPLKFFFSSGVQQDAGSDMAAEAIKDRIRGLIAAENPKKPLSDQSIAKSLSEDGIRVARRTVAKYREALGILSSSKRKQVF